MPDNIFDIFEKRRWMTNNHSSGEAWDRCRKRADEAERRDHERSAQIKARMKALNDPDAAHLIAIMRARL